MLLWSVIVMNNKSKLPTCKNLQDYWDSIENYNLDKEERMPLTQIAGSDLQDI